MHIEDVGWELGTCCFHQNLPDGCGSKSDPFIPEEGESPTAQPWVLLVHLEHSGFDVLGDFPARMIRSR